MVLVSLMRLQRRSGPVPRREIVQSSQSVKKKALNRQEITVLQLEAALAEEVVSPYPAGGQRDAMEGVCPLSDSVIVTHDAI